LCRASLAARSFFVTQFHANVFTRVPRLPLVASSSIDGGCGSAWISPSAALASEFIAFLRTSTLTASDVELDATALFTCAEIAPETLMNVLLARETHAITYALSACGRKTLAAQHLVPSI